MSLPQSLRFWLWTNPQPSFSRREDTGKRSFYSSQLLNQGMIWLWTLCMKRPWPFTPLDKIPACTEVITSSHKDPHTYKTPFSACRVPTPQLPIRTHFIHSFRHREWVAVDKSFSCQDSLVHRFDSALFFPVHLNFPSNDLMYLQCLHPQHHQDRNCPAPEISLGQIWASQKGTWKIWGKIWQKLAGLST